MQAIDNSFLLPLLATIATFVVGFITALFAYLRDAAQRDSAIRTDVLKENVSLREEMREHTRRLFELERQVVEKEAKIIIAENKISSLEALLDARDHDRAFMREQIADLKSQILSLREEITRYESRQNDIEAERVMGSKSHG